MSEARERYYKHRNIIISKFSDYADSYIFELEEQNKMMLDLLKKVHENTGFFGTEKVFEDIIQSVTGGKS